MEVQVVGLEVRKDHRLPFLRLLRLQTPFRGMTKEQRRNDLAPVGSPRFVDFLQVLKRRSLLGMICIQRRKKERWGMSHRHKKEWGLERE